MAIGWILFGSVTCCILMGLVLLWRTSGRVIEMVDDETQTLKECRSDLNVPMRVMITKNGKAAHCKRRLSIPFEIAFDSVSVLVFSLRSKRRFRKAHLEAARSGYENKF